MHDQEMNSKAMRAALEAIAVILSEYEPFDEMDVEALCDLAGEISSVVDSVPYPSVNEDDTKTAQPANDSAMADAIALNQSLYEEPIRDLQRLWAQYKSLHNPNEIALQRQLKHEIGINIQQLMDVLEGNFNEGMGNA